MTLGDLMLILQFLLKSYMLSILLWFLPPVFSTFSGNCPFAICMHRKTFWRNSSPAFDPLTQKWEQGFLLNPNSKFWTLDFFWIKSGKFEYCVFCHLPLSSEYNFRTKEIKKKKKKLRQGLFKVKDNKKASLNNYEMIQRVISSSQTTGTVKWTLE